MVWANLKSDINSRVLVFTDCMHLNKEPLIEVNIVVLGGNQLVFRKM